ncbi:hypothetical protein TREMEDRAFT_27959, partial [Tremella mesenterica DSM 1558]|uniref:uncharacterized protein n=1 Tax=Tremella mesenterica (strain ATCC 24925 / CBS 8224 / DSM 1558 / NBRC 9311 / NRRL Y-6157 / RJB 2259-6 / UBC 559-6) TaxID=578456 RepID=UPI0003F48DB9
LYSRTVCTPLYEAERILATLQPRENTHLDQKFGGRTGAAKDWGQGLGWGHEGPLSTTLRLLPRFLNFLSPLSLLSKIPFLPHSAQRRAGLVSKTRRERAERVLALLEDAERGGCGKVWSARGHVRMFPPKGLKQDLSAAYKAYKRSVEVTSDPEAQFMVGFFHATGLGNAEQDQGKAILYYTFAALNGYRPASMALGYRHWAGISVQEDCMTALGHYEQAAASAYQTFLSGPPGGRTLPLAPSRLSDQFGGIYGPHASWASTGANAHRPAVRASSASARGETESEILEYYQYHSDRDAHVYTVRLGRLFYLGSVYPQPGGIGSGAEYVGAIPQSYIRAKEYFTKVARVLWPVDFDANGQIAGKRRMSKESEESVREAAMVAAAFLGRMALRGEGGRRDYKRAKMWYERAAELGDREALNGLGLMHLHGLSLPPDPMKAYGYFQAAASQDLAEAQVSLGKLHLERGEYQQALTFLEAALRHGSPYEAFQLSSTIHARTARAGLEGMCGVAMAFSKVASERGSWEWDYLGEADKAWMRGEEEKAMLGWMVAAEMGYEQGQNNVAFVLDKGWKGKGWEGWWVSGKEKIQLGEERVLGLWLRSAGQDNVDALVKVGDYFYNNATYPVLTPKSQNYERALSYYATAAEYQTSSLAYWNLGYMYENGHGVPRDWHLAKRNYDLALEVSGEAYLAVVLSLGKLYLRSWWTDIKTGGRTPGLSLFEQSDRPAVTAWETFKNYFVDPPTDPLEPMDEFDDMDHFDPSGSGWHHDPAAQDVDREGHEGHGARGRVDWEEDPRVRGREREWEEDIDETVESLVILALGFGLVGLLWIRGQWARWDVGNGAPVEPRGAEIHGNVGEQPQRVPTESEVRTGEVPSGNTGTGQVGGSSRDQEPDRREGGEGEEENESSMRSDDVQEG